VNTPQRYERRLDRTIPEPASKTEAARPVEALAVHRDPSVPTSQATPESSGAPGVAWVRPSEMLTMLGSRYVRRGIDIEADLARRARRVPGAVVSKASRRIIRSSIARPDTPAPTTRTVTDQGGLGL